MKVVLKHGGRWLHFDQPEKVLVVERMDEVLPAIAEAEQSGLFAAGFISYEAAPAFDAALQTRPVDGFPLLCLGLFRAPDVMDAIEAPPDTHFTIGELKPSVSQAEFTRAIGTIKTRISEGATYQVNYTYRLNADFSGDAWAFFCALVKGQKTEYAAYVQTDEFSICSASPELFFSLKGGTLMARPMKGTAKRGRTLAEDRKQAEALRNSEKDCAENIMIVDMIRNDIGRVAESGSVETLSTYDVEQYPTVWQMTSTVQGRVMPQKNTGECGLFSGVLKALFPCASITGAPKAKTMEIITELEGSPRKIYTGSIGFMTPTGDASFNVAIRTALIENGQLEFGVGGGIVWDSNAESEYEETLTKARVLTQPRPEFQLLETMLWEPKAGVFLLNEHLQRLGRSAAYFDVPLDMHTVLQSLEDMFLTLDRKPHRIRLLVSRNGESEIQTFPLENDALMAPMTVAIARKPVDSQHIFLYHKTTHREVYETARAAFPNHADVILFNEQGLVTESTMANVVIRRDGKQITPPVSCGLLGGTFRAHLLELGEIEEGLVTLDDLQSADEIFLVNSVRKWKKASVESLEV